MFLDHIILRVTYVQRNSRRMRLTTGGMVMVAKIHTTAEALKQARNEQTKAYRNRNPDIIKEIRKRTDAKRKQVRREQELEKKYGLTYSDYLCMLESQNGVCSICGRPEKLLGKGGCTRPLNVDHCHTTGKVRGLLCASCNLALGNLEDNIAYLQNAISYLEKHSEELL